MRRLAAVLLAVLTVSGCWGSPGDAAAPSATPAPPTPDQVVDSAVARAMEHSTVRLRGEVRYEAGDAYAGMTEATGTVDLRRGRLSVRAGTLIPGNRWVSRRVWAGRSAWSTGTGSDADRWWRTTVVKTSRSWAEYGAIDPAELLRAALQASGRYSPGTAATLEFVTGNAVECTVYRGRVALSRKVALPGAPTVARRPGGLTAELRRTKATATIQVWVDPDGLPRRVSLYAVGRSDGKRIAYRIRMDLSGWGEPVTIRPPRKATVL